MVNNATEKFNNLVDNLDKLFKKSFNRKPDVDDYSYLTYKARPENKIMLNNVIDFLNENNLTSDEFYFLKNSLGDFMLPKRYTKNEFAKEFFSELGMFLDVTDGKLKRNDYEMFDYTNKVAEHRFEKKLASNGGVLTLILLPDGRCYASPSSHNILAKWLTINGISIEDGVRMYLDKTRKLFMVSGLGRYDYSMESTGKLDPVITNEQATAITKIYKMASDITPRLTDINKVVQWGDIFGCGDPLNKISKNNLENLKRLECADPDVFDIKFYSRYTKQSMSDYIYDFIYDDQGEK